MVSGFQVDYSQLLLLVILFPMDLNLDLLTLSQEYYPFNLSLAALALKLFFYELINFI